MKHRLLLVVLLLLFVATVAAQTDSGVPVSPEKATLLEKYRTELESSFVITAGDPFSQTLPDPLLVVGSNLDTLEKEFYPRIRADFPDIPHVQDTETAYNGRSIYDYNLVLIGGPKHNRVSRALYEDGIYDFHRNTSKLRIVILGIPNATSAGAAVLYGTVYGFEFTSDKWVPIMALIPPEAVPAAAVATGIALAGLAPEFLNFIKKFLKTATEEIGEEVLLDRTSHKQTPRSVSKMIILGVSRVELMHIIASFILFGIFMDWAVSSKSLFIQNLPAYLIGAGLALVGHEFLHNFTSYRSGIESEFRISPVGMVSVAITSVLFGNVFATPGMTHLYGEASPDQRGKVALSGPLVSFVMVVLFWLLAGYGGFAGSVGQAGFGIAFIMAVFEMLPIRPMDGKEVKSWNRWVWRLYFVPVFLLYAWTFLV